MTTRDEGGAALRRAAADLLERDGVETTRMFGGDAVRSAGKIVGFVGTEGELVVKLPAARADALVDAGRASRVRIGRNPAREWVGVPLPADGDVEAGDVAWSVLLEEAEAYVRSLAG